LKNNKGASDSNQDKPIGMRNVIALGFVSFFTDFSTEMTISVMYSYRTQIIHKNFLSAIKTCAIDF